MDPWFEDAIGLLSTRSGSLAFSRAASVLDSELSRMRQERKPKAHKTSESNLREDPIVEFEDLKRTLKHYQDDISKLQAANADLTQVNKRWHSYNSDMQLFIEKLQSTIRDQQEQINSIGEATLFSNRSTVESEPCSRRECQSLQEEVTKLREENGHLQFQVKAHKDDWEAEKNEKQEAIKDRDALQERLNDVLRDVCLGNRSESRGCCCSRSWDRTRRPRNTQGFTGSNYNHRPGEDREDGAGSPNIVSSEENLSERHLEDTACALRPREESYSLTSTVPLVTPGVSPCSSNGSVHSTFAMGIKSGGTTVTSFVQLPVVKSSSAPERRSHGFKKPPKFVNSISLSVLPPGSRGKRSTREQCDTVEDESLNCSKCGRQFPSSGSYLDHYDSCRQQLES